MLGTTRSVVTVETITMRIESRSVRPCRTRRPAAMAMSRALSSESRTCRDRMPTRSSGKVGELNSMCRGSGSWARRAWRTAIRSLNSALDMAAPGRSSPGMARAVPQTAMSERRGISSCPPGVDCFRVVMGALGYGLVGKVLQALPTWRRRREGGRPLRCAGRPLGPAGQGSAPPGLRPGPSASPGRSRWGCRRPPGSRSGSRSPCRGSG